MHIITTKQIQISRITKKLNKTRGRGQSEYPKYGIFNKTAASNKNVQQQLTNSTHAEDSVDRTNVRAREIGWVCFFSAEKHHHAARRRFVDFRIWHGEENGEKMSSHLECVSCHANYVSICVAVFVAISADASVYIICTLCAKSELISHVRWTWSSETDAHSSKF